MNTRSRPAFPLERMTLDRLYSIIRLRDETKPLDSYTAKLLGEGPEKCAKKFGEEAVETVIEASKRDRQKFIEEMGQALYHGLVLMRSMNVTPRDIEDYLALVHAQKTGDRKADKRGT
jgi:phosphoribosyl-ATP pyrophosphohydrolase